MKSCYSNFVIFVIIVLLILLGARIIVPYTISKQLKRLRRYLSFWQKDQQAGGETGASLTCDA